MSVSSFMLMRVSIYILCMLKDVAEEHERTGAGQWSDVVVLGMFRFKKSVYDKA